MKYVAELKGRDLLEAEISNSQVQLKVVGCSQLLELVRQLKNQNPDPRQWPLPKGNSHSEILVRELILKAKGEWAFPYQEIELCHCRAIPAEDVDQAIIAGAHTPEQVSRQTSASTACGTCRPDVEKILKYRLRGAS